MYAFFQPLLANLGRGCRRRRDAMRYLEDFCIGQQFGSGRLRTAQTIKSFAVEFNPQPFHVAANAGLAASGWHRAAPTKRLLLESENKPWAVLTRWGSTNCARPVRLGDEQRLEKKVPDIHPSLQI